MSDEVKIPKLVVTTERITVNPRYVDQAGNPTTGGPLGTVPSPVHKYICHACGEDVKLPEKDAATAVCKGCGGVLEEVVYVPKKGGE